MTDKLRIGEFALNSGGAISPVATTNEIFSRNWAHTASSSLKFLRCGLDLSREIQIETRRVLTLRDREPWLLGLSETFD